MFERKRIKRDLVCDWNAGIVIGVKYYKITNRLTNIIYIRKVSAIFLLQLKQLLWNFPIAVHYYLPAICSVLYFLKLPIVLSHKNIIICRHSDLMKDQIISLFLQWKTRHSSLYLLVVLFIQLKLLLIERLIHWQLVVILENHKRWELSHIKHSHQLFIQIRYDG